MRSDELLLMKIYDTGAGGQALCESPEYLFQIHATDDFALQSVLMSRSITLTLRPMLLLDTVSKVAVLSSVDLRTGFPLM